jgi:hypothetical protein
MKTIICKAFEGKLRVVEEVLSDNSKVYNIEIGSETDYDEIPCYNKEKAISSYSEILLILEKSTKI